MSYEKSIKSLSSDLKLHERIDEYTSRDEPEYICSKCGDVSYQEGLCEFCQKGGEL